MFEGDGYRYNLFEYIYISCGHDNSLIRTYDFVIDASASSL